MSFKVQYVKLKEKVEVSYGKAGKFNNRISARWVGSFGAVYAAGRAVLHSYCSDCAWYVLVYLEKYFGGSETYEEI